MGLQYVIFERHKCTNKWTVQYNEHTFLHNMHKCDIYAHVMYFKDMYEVELG